MAFAAGAAVLLTAAVLRLLGPLNAGLLRLQQSFRPSAPFSLFDSLPALSPGLSSLEAFSLSLPPGTPANADRSLWLSDRLDTLRFAFHSDRVPFDSATLYLWAGDSVRQTTLRRRGSHDWNVPLNLPISGWTEIAGLYLSYPPLFTVRTGDPSVAVFERLEGSVLHVVSRSYASPAEPLVPPDTAYPAPRSGELLLLARGKTFAVVNPTRQAVRLRLLSVEEGSNTLHDVPAGAVQVYRGMLPRNGTLLAYTMAGTPLCMLGKCREPRPEFFGLRRRPHEQAP